MPDLLSPMVNPSTMHECPTRGKRMLILRGTTNVEEQVFRDVRVVMDNLLKINLDIIQYFFHTLLENILLSKKIIYLKNLIMPLVNILE